MADPRRHLIAAGAALGLFAVALGAFGAHALKSYLAPDLLAVYQTGVQYHLPHAVAVMVIGLLCLNWPTSPWLRRAGWTMVAGVVIFSGSLYLLAITGVRTWGVVTPIGGVLLLAAWAMVAAAALSAKE